MIESSVQTAQELNERLKEFDVADAQPQLDIENGNTLCEIGKMRRQFIDANRYISRICGSRVRYLSSLAIRLFSPLKRPQNRSSHGIISHPCE